MDLFMAHKFSVSLVNKSKVIEIIFFIKNKKKESREHKSGKNTMVGDAEKARKIYRAM